MNQLRSECVRMSELNGLLEVTNKNLDASVNRLQGDLKQMEEENNRFAENNQQLKEQVGALNVGIFRANLVVFCHCRSLK